MHAACSSGPEDIDGRVVVEHTIELRRQDERGIHLTDDLTRHLAQAWEYTNASMGTDQPDSDQHL